MINWWALHNAVLSIMAFIELLLFFQAWPPDFRYIYISEIEKKCLPGPESLPAKLAVCELILTCMGVVSNFFAQTTQFKKYVLKIKMCSKFSHFKGH